MKAIFSKLAQKELEDSIVYYDLQFRGLGQRFKSSVKDAIQLMLKYPDAYPIEKGEVRRCLLHKFPYKILYSIEKEYIFIIAIAHLHRKPDYWID